MNTRGCPIKKLAWTNIFDHIFYKEGFSQPANDLPVCRVPVSYTHLDALKKAKELRAQQIPAELIPAIPGTGSSDTGSFEKNVKIYREKSKNHMQKAFYYMPAEGGCMEELLDRN